MSNFIHNLHIENFKSIKSLDLKCKRINVFVGKPNVGKSNILEAVGLYGAGYEEIRFDKPYLQDLIRFEKYSNLFFDNLRDKPILITTELGYCYLDYTKEGKYRIFITENQIDLDRLIADSSYQNQRSITRPLEETRSSKYIVISDDLALDTRGYSPYVNGYSPVKKYEYRKNQDRHSRFDHFLLPPFGWNIGNIIEQNPKLHQQFGEIFEDYGLQFVYDKEESRILIQKQKDKVVYRIPFSLIADTLQRYIFNLTAIRTNQNSILVLEEPEAHSFPDYIKDIAEEIVKSETNQFFIATHSPYLLNTLLEKTTYDEMAFFVTWYEDYETKARELTEAEVDQLMDYGIDIFFNLNAYLEKK